MKQRTLTAWRADNATCEVLYAPEAADAYTLLIRHFTSPVPKELREGVVAELVAKVAK